MLLKIYFSGFIIMFLLNTILAILLTLLDNRGFKWLICEMIASFVNSFVWFNPLFFLLKDCITIERRKNGKE